MQHRSGASTPERRRRAGPRGGQPPGRTGPRPNPGTPPAHATTELKRCCGQSLLCVCAVACGCAQPLPFSAFLGAVASRVSSGSFPVAGPVEPLLFGSLTRWAALVFPCADAGRFHHIGQPPVAPVRAHSGVDTTMGDIHAAHFTQPLREGLSAAFALRGGGDNLRPLLSLHNKRHTAVHPTSAALLFHSRETVITTPGAHLSPARTVGDVRAAHRTEPLRERLPARTAKTRLGGCSRCGVRTHRR